MARDQKYPDDVAQQLVEGTVGDRAPFTPKQILQALRMGHLVYELIPNVMPVILLTLRLPIVDPANTTAYLPEAELAMTAFKLNRAWYWWVEHRCAPAEEGLDLYSRMWREFAERRSKVKA